MTAPEIEIKLIRAKEREARKAGDKELAGLLADLYRLKTSYIPQMLEYFEKPDYPNKLKLKKPTSSNRVTIDRIITELKELDV